MAALDDPDLQPLWSWIKREANILLTAQIQACSRVTSSGSL
jgi:hypothetical protein